MGLLAWTLTLIWRAVLRGASGVEHLAWNLCLAGHQEGDLRSAWWEKVRQPPLRGMRSDVRSLLDGPVRSLPRPLP